MTLCDFCNISYVKKYYGHDSYMLKGQKSKKWQTLSINGKYEKNWLYKLHISIVFSGGEWIMNIAKIFISFV